MPMRVRVFLFAAVAILTSGLVHGAGREEPFRFLVMGDPQFHVPTDDAWEPTLSYGYQWQSPAWQHVPALMKRLDAKYFFVCGDIFEYHDGDGTAVSELWDVWDRYVDKFAGIGRVEWVTGGHEFWGKDAEQDRQYFLQRYPNHVRYLVRDGPHAFILFDDVHNPLTFGSGGLEWLDETLRQCQDAEHIWFFGHVPPRNTANWWPTRRRPGELDAFRSRMAALLGQRGTRAAFFGHEHRETNLGDRGGFPMFVAACRYPLLVEVRGDRVEYRWIMEPASEDPLATALPVEGDPLAAWRLAPVPAQMEWPAPPALPDSLDALPFRPAAAGADGSIDLSAVEGLPPGVRVVAVAEWTFLAGWHHRCARVRSSAPYSLWINGRFLESGGATDGRFNGYEYELSEPNRAVLILEPADGERTFTFVPHSFPEEMRAEQQRQHE